jgi:hypothetical protein
VIGHKVGVVIFRDFASITLGDIIKVTSCANIQENGSFVKTFHADGRMDNLVRGFHVEVLVAVGRANGVMVMHSYHFDLAICLPELGDGEGNRVIVARNHGKGTVGEG